MVDGRTMLRRRPLLKSILAGAGASVMLARHGRANAEKLHYGGQLRVAYPAFPGSLDPALGRAGGDAYYWKQAFDQLVDADPGLNPRAATSLAESWDITDTAITLHLRKGVVFHDGTPFNAEAVKFNIERVLDPATKATPRATFSPVAGAEVVDETTVRLNLKKPWGSALSMLADRGGAMSSPTAIKALGVDYAFKPAGTGPFKVAEIVSGSHVKFVRNEKYWGRDADGNKLPYLDEVVIRLITDETVQVSALKAGEIDLVLLPYREVQNFEHDPKWQIKVFEGGSVAYLLQFNLTKPPMDNVNLRLAVAYAINPDVINKAVYFNHAIVAKGGMWPPGSWAYDPTVERPHYDPAKAREFLKLGGKPDGFETDVITWTSDLHRPSAEIVRAQLAAVGIKLNLKVYEVTVATEKFEYGGEAPLFLTSWSRYPEPDWNASLIYRSDGYYNPGKLKDARVDALIDAGAAISDIAKRKPIYRQIDEIELGEARMVPLLYGVSNATAPNNVMGLNDLFGWDAKFNFKQIWLKPA